MSSSPVPINIDVTRVLSDTIKEISSYAQAKQVEKTERERIKAQLKYLTIKLKEENSTLRQFLLTHERNRQEVYKTADEAMKQALELHDTELAKLAMDLKFNTYQEASKNECAMLTNIMTNNRLLD